MPPKKEGTTFDIARILVTGRYLAEEDLERARKAAKSRGTSLTDALIEDGIITKDLLGQAVAEALDVPYADLNSKVPSAEMIRKIPEDVARKYRAILYQEAEDGVVVATDIPKPRGFAAALKPVFGGRNISRAYSLPQDIDGLLNAYRQPLVGRLTTLQEGGGLPAPAIVSEIIQDAATLGASDIHLEPYTEELIVRFRVDGVMQEVARMKKDYHAIVLNRIKVLARMRLDDHFSAQDGAIRYKLQQETLDIRVSIVPTLEGEKIVMRLLTGRMRGLALSELGLSPRHQDLLEKAIRKPFGMILTTGPTGSGKTTTLYASMKTLDQAALNITTIEDPVEYRLVGINQIQVNPQVDLTFGKGLRAIVRQNPDVIMVGEIRDEDTAEIAVNAALTGHLLFSTFHANDAATSVVRLMDIGVEPFLLSSTLELIMAQRLVRRICESCRVSVSAAELKKMDIPDATMKHLSKGTKMYHGKGCAVCNGVGYRGRIGIFEFIPVSRQIRELILKQPSTQQVWELARKEGARSLFEDGMEKVHSGVTSLAEVTRVANPTE